MEKISTHFPQFEIPAGIAGHMDCPMAVQFFSGLTAEEQTAALAVVEIAFIIGGECATEEEFSVRAREHTGVTAGEYEKAKQLMIIMRDGK